MLIKCLVHDRANYSLSIQTMNGGKQHHPSVDGKKIKWSSNTSFNVTELAYNDSGRYICETLWSTDTAGGNYMARKTRYFLTVLKKGNTYMFKLKTDADMLL